MSKWAEKVANNVLNKALADQRNDSYVRNRTPFTAAIAAALDEAVGRDAGDDRDKAEALQSELHEAIKVIVLASNGRLAIGATLDWVFMNYPDLYRQQAGAWLSR